MSRTVRALVIAGLLMATSSVGVGQESLRDIVEDQGFGWMAGQWKATMDDGTDISLGYTWGANGHALIVDFKMGDRSGHGIIYFVADEEQVRQFNVDSQGRVTRPIWESQGTKAVCKTTWFDEYGASTDVAFAYSRVDSKTMKVEVYTVENGQLSWDSVWESNFARQQK